MANYVLYENYNPVIGAVEKDGTQTIGVHDFKSGNRRYIKTSKENVDEFINERKEKLDKTDKKSVLIVIGGALIGAVAGFKVINKLVKIPEGDNIAKNLKCFFKGIGTIVGSGFCAIPSMLIAVIRHNSADKEVTQKFIDENK